MGTDGEASPLRQDRNRTCRSDYEQKAVQKNREFSEVRLNMLVQEPNRLENPANLNLQRECLEVILHSIGICDGALRPGWHHVNENWKIFL